MSTLSSPAHLDSPIRKVAILFAGGPAPAANAVISTAAVSFLRNDIQVVGVLHGYSHLVEFGPDHPLVEGRDYVMIDHKILSRTRNSQGILIGTARTNPGQQITRPEHLADPAHAQLRTVYEALASLEVDALVSIGGDDTLKTANKFMLFQEHLPAGAAHAGGAFAEDDRQRLQRHRLHVWLFHGGRNLGQRDPQPAGRRRGFTLVLPDRDHGAQCRLVGLRRRDRRRSQPGRQRRRHHGQVPRRRIVYRSRDRRERHPAGDEGRGSHSPHRGHDARAETTEKKEFGVIVIAEGLAEYLPQKYLEGVGRDEHGHISISQVNLCRRFAKLISEEYAKQTGKLRRVTGLQLGYEARCSRRTPLTSCWGASWAWGPIGPWSRRS